MKKIITLTIGKAMLTIAIYTSSFDSANSILF